MIVSYSQIVGNEVLAIKEQKSVGRVSDLIIQKTDLKIKAAALAGTFFFSPKKIITFGDIAEFDKSAVVVQSEDDIADLSEVIPVQQAIKSKLLGARQKVYTKSKKFVGSVYDYTFESQSGLIYSLFVRNILVERVISRASIIEIDRDRFIIEDDFELIKSPAEMLERA